MTTFEEQFPSNQTTKLFDERFPKLRNSIYLGCGIEKLKQDIIMNCLDAQKVREAIEKCEVIDQRGSEPIIRWIDKERFLKELGL